jgi:hypothetical protein
MSLIGELVAEDHRERLARITARPTPQATACDTVNLAGLRVTSSSLCQSSASPIGATSLSALDLAEERLSRRLRRHAQRRANLTPRRTLLARTHHHPAACAYQNLVGVA